jgi:hypothetical protein
MNSVVVQGQLQIIQWEKQKAWIDTADGDVLLIWDGDDENIQKGMEQLQADDTVLVKGHVRMSRSSGMEMSGGYVRITTIEAQKPAQRAKKANNWFEITTNELHSVEYYRVSYQRRLDESSTELHKARREGADAIEAMNLALDAKKHQEEAFKEALMDRAMGGGE